MKMKNGREWDGYAFKGKKTRQVVPRPSRYVRACFRRARWEVVYVPNSPKATVMLSAGRLGASWWKGGTSQGLRRHVPALERPGYSGEARAQNVLK